MKPLVYCARIAPDASVPEAVRSLNNANGLSFTEAILLLNSEVVREEIPQTGEPQRERIGNLGTLMGDQLLGFPTGLADVIAGGGFTALSTPILTETARVGLVLYHDDAALATLMSKLPNLYERKDISL